VTEVPSFERSRIHGVSNLHAIRDGIRVVRTILTERRRIQHPDVPATVPAPVLPDNDVSRTGPVTGMKDRDSDLIFGSHQGRG
jgi:hypothetical protein